MIAKEASNFVTDGEGELGGLLRTNVGSGGQQVGESCQARPRSEGNNQAGQGGKARTAPSSLLSATPVLDARIRHHSRLGQVMSSKPSLRRHHLCPPGENNDAGSPGVDNQTPGNHR